MAAFPGACLVSRPGLIVGPHDPTGRFTWWVRRFARAAAGDEVIAPGDPTGPAQLIDARDLAAWHLRQAEAGTTGIFNVTGPAAPLTFNGLIETLRATLAPQARPVWVAEEFLLDQGVAPWSELPVWLPQADAGLHRVDIGRAIATGLHCRPLAETVSDIAAGMNVASPAPAGGPPRAPVGLPPAREAALLAAWHTRIPS
jgi:2'-hydroxyisoflavone reductase